MIGKDLIHQAAEDIDLFLEDLSEEYEQLRTAQSRRLRLWPIVAAACLVGALIGLWTIIRSTEMPPAGGQPAVAVLGQDTVSQVEKQEAIDLPVTEVPLVAQAEPVVVKPKANPKLDITEGDMSLCSNVEDFPLLVVYDHNIVENADTSGIDIDRKQYTADDLAAVIGVQPEKIQAYRIFEGIDALSIWGTRGSNGVLEVVSPEMHRQLGEEGFAQVTTDPVRVRGFGSANQGNPSLILLDGHPYDGDLTSINSAEIKSFTVLKDSVSLAMYGAEGYEAMIVVLTKDARQNGNTESGTGSPDFGGVLKDTPATSPQILVGVIGGLPRDTIANSHAEQGHVGSQDTRLVDGYHGIRPLIVVNKKELTNISEEKWKEFSLTDMDNESFARLIGVDVKDIKKIWIIKDSASTARWGDKGLLGVIEIKISRKAYKKIRR